MFRSIEFRSLLKSQSLVKQLRSLTTQPEKAFDSKFQQEWDNAKPFESIPAMTKIQAIRNFMPGGEYSHENIRFVDPLN